MCLSTDKSRWRATPFNQICLRKGTVSSELRYFSRDENCLWEGTLPSHGQFLSLDVNSQRGENCPWKGTLPFGGQFLSLYVRHGISKIVTLTSLLILLLTSVTDLLSDFWCYSREENCLWEGTLPFHGQFLSLDNILTHVLKLNILIQLCFSHTLSSARLLLTYLLISWQFAIL